MGLIDNPISGVYKNYDVAQDSMHCKDFRQLKITEKVKRYVVKVLQEARERKKLSGKDPIGLATTASCISFVKNEVSITQRDLAEVAIRNRYKGLKLSQQTNHTIL